MPNAAPGPTRSDPRPPPSGCRDTPVVRAQRAPARRSPLLLRADCGAAVLAGLTVLALSGWLSELYALPRALLVGMGVANLAYGAFSGSLARRARRSRGHIRVLVAANATWAVLCVLAAARLAGTASTFGLAHLVGEGLFVGGLAALEWRARDRLAGAS